LSADATKDSTASLNGGRSSLLDIVSQGWRPYFLLTLLCAIVFLPGISSIPPTDRDESRFMQATKQMLESGDWIHIRFQDVPRNKKPIGIYWLQAATVKIAGQSLTTAWPYRLPSVLAAWLAVLATFASGRYLFGSKAGLISATVLATSFIVIVEAHIAKTDAALLAATTVAMTMLARCYITRDGSRPFLAALLFWLALGGGFLLKGPVILLVAFATIAALGIADRDVRWLKGLHAAWGIPVMLLVVLPWLIAVSGGTQSSFIADSVRQDLLPKLIGGQESHGAPPGMYLLTTLLTAWPWSLLAPFVLIAAWRARRVAAIRFHLAWLIPSWIVFEVVPTKLPHYTMPLYPALALLTGWALNDPGIRSDIASWLRSLMGLSYRMLWGGLAFALAAGVLYASTTYGDGSIIGAALAAAVVVITAFLVMIAVGRLPVAGTWIGFAMASVLFTVSLTSQVLPRLRQLAVSPRVAELVRQQSQEPVALAGFHEPSAVFLLGTETRLTDGIGAAAYALAHPGTRIVVSTEFENAVRVAISEAGRSLRSHGEIDGYNYSRGRWLHLTVFSVDEKPPGETAP
jgi:4-amino-4-deoxy-L-arabinose transferase-like glycosyltransferase